MYIVQEPCFISGYTEACRQRCRETASIPSARMEKNNVRDEDGSVGMCVFRGRSAV